MNPPAGLRLTIAAAALAMPLAAGAAEAPAVVAPPGVTAPNVTAPNVTAPKAAPADAIPTNAVPDAAAPAAAAAVPGWSGGCLPAACLWRLTSAEGTATLLLARRAGSDGLAVGFAFHGVNADRDRPLGLVLDGRPLPTLKPGSDIRPTEIATESWIVGGEALGRLAGRLAGGGLLRLSYLDILGGPHDATFALAGAAERLAGLGVGDPAAPRLGPPAPRPDLVLPSRIEAIRALGVPERLKEMHARMTGCEALDSPRLAGRAPLIAALSPTAILYALPCAAGRDGVLSRLWVVEFGEIGGIQPQFFALYQPRQGWTGTDLLAGVAWDGDRLTARGSPVGGCAWTAAWRWRGTVFGLDDLTLAPCAGRRTPLRVVPAP